ncbi:MAG: DUF1295 domain-containing protein [Clostridia bacterium]|nr:DUF1295 domain-containing protein [Clostridia bacterium]
MKNSRTYSFIAIFTIYLIAIAIGLLTYNLLPFSMWANLLLADIAATLITFIFSVILKNASVYDPYWSVQPMVITLAFAIGQSMNIFKILLLCAIFYWGIRLTANWAYTFKNLNHQDWRYTYLHEKTKSWYPIINLLGIHLFPTIVVYLCTLPAVYAITSSVTGNVWSYIFLAISFFAATLQLVSDIQMQKFRRKQSGGIITTGIWAYSRHPNYLGEILMWWGISLACICALGFSWYLLIGAIINTLMFLFISIPMAENRLHSRSGYDEYKKKTSMLLILPKRK